MGQGRCRLVLRWVDGALKDEDLETGGMGVGDEKPVAMPGGVKRTTRSESRKRSALGMDVLGVNYRGGMPELTRESVTVAENDEA